MGAKPAKTIFYVAIALLVPLSVLLSWWIMPVQSKPIHFLEPPSQPEEQPAHGGDHRAAASVLCVQEAQSVIEALWRQKGVKTRDLFPKGSSAESFRELSLKALLAEWKAESKPAVDANGSNAPALRRRLGRPKVHPCSTQESCRGCPPGTFEIISLPPESAGE